MPANAANTQDLVEIKAIRDGVILLGNGSMVQIIMVGGVNFALKSGEEQNIIVNTYQNFLNSLDFPLQIIIHSRKINIEKYLSSLEVRKDGEPSGLLRSQISEYQEFIRSFVGQFAIMRKIFLVAVPFYPLNTPSVGSIASFLPFGHKAKKAAATPAPTDGTPENMAEFNEHAIQLKQRVDQVVEGMRPVGLEVTVLNDEQLVELFYNFYNPESVERDSIAAAGPNATQAAAVADLTPPTTA